MPADGVFSGPCQIRVTHKAAASRRMRFRLSDATMGNGVFPVVIATLLRVDGDPWRLEIEWETYSTGWGLSYVEQEGAYDLRAGLVYKLTAHNGNPTAGTVGHFDLIATVTSRDPDLAPPHPEAKPPDFSTKKG